VSEEDNDPEQAQSDKDMQKNLALLAKYFKKFYKPTNNNLRTSSNSRNKTEDTTQRKPKRVKDYTYHKKKMMMCKQAEQGVPLQAEQADWLEDTDEKIDQFHGKDSGAWSNHTRSSFRNPTAHDMEVLIKSLSMPLSIKTINDSYCFVHELKTEMHEDFEYVESHEKEIDKLESEKADFSNIYDLLLKV
ncbi:hypothetical protein Tco_0096052, partial [Tanacetum coccineum]